MLEIGKRNSFVSSFCRMDGRTGNSIVLILDILVESSRACM